MNPPHRPGQLTDRVSRSAWQSTGQCGGGTIRLSGLPAGSSPAVQPDHRDDLTEAPARDSTTIGEVSAVDLATVTYLAQLTSGSAARERLHSRVGEPPTYRTESAASRPLRHGNLATLVMLLANVAVLPVQVITIRPMNTVRAGRNPRRMCTLGSLFLNSSLA
jgi:hypothetical protein